MDGFQTEKHNIQCVQMESFSVNLKVIAWMNHTSVMDFLTVLDLWRLMAFLKLLMKWVALEMV